MIELCPQCHHPKHLKAHETKSENPGAFEYDGGCPVMVYLEPRNAPVGKGYYHEHCDCGGGEEGGE